MTEPYKAQGACETGATLAAARLHEFITAEIGNRLNTTQGCHLFKLKWSPNMPDDDPHAEYLVVDDDGNEYTIEIDVWVHPTRKTHQEEKK